jgi:hypothetical protein
MISYSDLFITTLSGSNFANVSTVTYSSSPVGTTITISEQYPKTEMHEVIELLRIKSCVKKHKT